ncbi:hypothetical protein ON010_g8413 [Phytophthora cinnamomi]|nr:hypothetical protein ON010_g8413 [Phytophthora cinnamomi]
MTLGAAASGAMGFVGDDVLDVVLVVARVAQVLAEEPQRALPGVRDAGLLGLLQGGAQVPLAVRGAEAHVLVARAVLQLDAHQGAVANAPSTARPTRSSASRTRPTSADSAPKGGSSGFLASLALNPPSIYRRPRWGVRPVL